ncbi:MAG: hypothetical protein WBD31_06160 [Rubripirellula sp.]
MQVEREATTQLAAIGGFANSESLLCFPLDLVASHYEFPLFDRVTRMMMAESPVTDAHLIQVASFHHLNAIFLEHTPVTNDSLKHLSGLTKLRKLSLGSTRVDDRGLVTLASLKHLQWLWLDRTAVSDDSIETLINFADLRRLNIRNTRISDAGVAKIRKALPGCMISH